nr:altered inheritance rate of mitochondria protein 25 [Quercus suber]
MLAARWSLRLPRTITAAANGGRRISVTEQQHRWIRQVPRRTRPGPSRPSQQDRGASQPYVEKSEGAIAASGQSLSGPSQRSQHEQHATEQPQPGLNTQLATTLAQSDTSDLVAEVHMPDDPDGVLPPDHPALALLGNSSLVIQRQIEMMNIIVGFEQANRYIIMDGQGTTIGYIAEQDHGIGSSLARNVFTTHRSFTTHIFDRQEREVLRIHRPFAFINSRIRIYDPVPAGGYKDTETSTALQGTSASSVTNQGSLAQISPLKLDEMRIIGEAQQQWAPLRRKYNLFTYRPLVENPKSDSTPRIESGEKPTSDTLALVEAKVPEQAIEAGMLQFAHVDEPFLSWDFNLRNEQQNPVGSVNRNFSGFAREIFTDTGVYVLRMDSAASMDNASSRESTSLTQDQRAVMLATAVSIDFDYFSRHSGHSGFMPLWLPFGGGGAAAEGAGAGAAGAGAIEGAGAGAVGAAGRGVAGGAAGEGAIAGAGAMAGYEAMQRGAYGGGQQHDGSGQQQDIPPEERLNDNGSSPVGTEEMFDPRKYDGQGQNQPSQQDESFWDMDKDPWAPGSGDGPPTNVGGGSQVNGATSTIAKRHSDRKNVIRCAHGTIPSIVDDVLSKLSARQWQQCSIESDLQFSLSCTVERYPRAAWEHRGMNLAISASPEPGVKQQNEYIGARDTHVKVLQQPCSLRIADGAKWGSLQGWGANRSRTHHPLTKSEFAPLTVCNVVGDLKSLGHSTQSRSGTVHARLISPAAPRQLEVDLEALDCDDWCTYCESFRQFLYGPPAVVALSSLGLAIIDSSPTCRMAEDAPSSPPQRVSRYRSQRKAQLAQADATPPELPQLPNQDEPDTETGVLRSKSRYHRKHVADSRPGTAKSATTAAHERSDSSNRAKPERYHSPGTTATARPLPSNHESRVASGSSAAHSRRVSSPCAPGMTDGRPVASKEQDPDADGRHANSRYNKGRESGGQAVPISRPQPPDIQPPPPAVPLPTGKLFPPPRPEPVKSTGKPMRADGPPTSGQIRATKSVSALPKAIDDDDDQEPAGCLSLFKRKRGDMSSSDMVKSEPIARPIAARNEPEGMKPGGGGVVPGMDAPVSAVNAGDRQVMVECGKTKRIFPVTPTTTPVDLIKSASIIMSERINLQTAVLLEYFGTVGVQRPLRRYEHIRDVMNSWDTDKQNSLLLIDPTTGSSEAELSIAGAPTQRPGDATWLLFYSQKVGKWETRHITLKEDGQLTMLKDLDKPQQQENVCHLSDFDIYRPTPEKLKKKVKPPKRHCFAVKSQQKTIMFESTSNFVHFFSTGDGEIADSFHTALQSWRSWYLVNVMGEGEKTKRAETTPAGQSARASNDHNRGHKAQESFSSHYELGTFKPLLAMEDFQAPRPSSPEPNEGRPSTAAGATGNLNAQNSHTSPEKKKSTSSRKQHPPGAMSNKPRLAEDEPLANLARHDSTTRKRRPTVTEQSKATTDEFLASGLLGRSYSQRQRDAAEREPELEVPWTTGPNLLNGNHFNDTPARASTDNPRRDPSNLSGSTPPTNLADPRRKPSTRGAQARAGSTDLPRSTSRAREKPKPLIDLTPEAPNAPQPAVKGKGFQPSQIGPGGLIDSATGLKDPLAIASGSTSWRGRNNAFPATATGRARADSRPGQKPEAARAPAEATALSGSDAAFVEGGLLSTVAQPGYTGVDRGGRGVMDGAHAKGPMLDVQLSSEFAQGSLLNRVEREHGGPAGPVIDREWDRRVVREERYGEAA